MRLRASSSRFVSADRTTVSCDSASSSCSCKKSMVVIMYIIGQLHCNDVSDGCSSLHGHSKPLSGFDRDLHTKRYNSGGSTTQGLEGSNCQVIVIRTDQDQTRMTNKFISTWFFSSSSINQTCSTRGLHEPWLHPWPQAACQYVGLALEH